MTFKRKEILKKNQLWGFRAFTRCSQPMTFAFEASSEALPTWPFEVSHPRWWLPIRSAGKECKLSFLEFIETALGDSPSPIQLVVAQDCLQHFAEAPIEDGRNTSFNSVRTTDPFLRIISLDDNCHSYQNCSVNLIKHLLWVLSTLQIHRANHQGHIVQNTPENEHGTSRNGPLKEEIPFGNPHFQLPGVYITAAFRRWKIPTRLWGPLQFLAQEFGVMCEAWAHWQNQRNRYPKSSKIIQNHPKSSEIIQRHQWLSSQSLSISQIWDGHVHDEAFSANLRTAMSWIYQRLQVYCLQALSWSNWGKVIWCHMMSYDVICFLEKYWRFDLVSNPKLSYQQLLNPSPKSFPGHISNSCEVLVI